MKMSIVFGAIALLLLLIVLTNFIYLTPKGLIDNDFSVSGTSNNTDIEQIKDHTLKLKEYWDKGDSKGYAQLFDETADYITFLGDRLKGRQQIDFAHQKLFNDVLKGSKMTIKIKHINFLSENSVLIIATGSVNPNPKKIEESRKSIQTLTAIKQGEKWIFTSFQNTRIKRLSLFDVLIEKFKG
jgi:uncharacterized protein (TIGR02246 family)